MRAYDRVVHILEGIDKCETDDPKGWWETSTGAAFGAGKLQQIQAVFTQRRKENWWPLRRRKQAREMEALLRDIAQLNDGNHMIQNLRRCIKRAKRLLKTDYNSNNVSFTQFIDNTMFGD